MRVGRCLVAASVLCIVGAPVARSQTLNVPADHTTIQGAIVAAVNGDVVNVAAGTFTESLDLLGKSITVQGAAGADETTVVSTGGRPVIVTSSAGNFVIRGLTLTSGATGSHNAGIDTFGSASGLIERNVFTELFGCGALAASLNGGVVFRQNIVYRNRTSCTGGGAIGTVRAGGTSEVRNNLIVNNSGSNGGAVAVEGSPVVSGNVMSANGGTGTVYVWAGTPTITNNLITRNRGTAGVYVDFLGTESIQITNNTVADNQTGVAARVDVTGANGVVLKNNVLSAPSGSVLGCFDRFGTLPVVPTFTSNDLFGPGPLVLPGSVCDNPVGSNGNLTVDPGFVDAPGGDYHLASSSPLIDAGVATGAPTNDFDGDPRPLDGNPASPGAQVDVGLDETGGSAGPETTLSGGPPSLVGPGPWPAFSFSSPTAGATFECDVDLQGFTPCVSPFSLNATGSRVHMFQVRARTAAGVIDRTPATRMFEADLVPPQTIHEAGPFRFLASWRAIFRSDEASATFECALDTGPFTTCASPHDFAAPSSGTHTFHVRAKDTFGNVDPTPVSTEFFVPLPDTTIATPVPVENSNRYSITITSDVANATFECSLDGAPFTSCTSPLVLTVSLGAHTLAARAISGGDVDPTPASVVWTNSCTLFGSAAIDTLLGTLGDDQLCGLGSDDLLRGLAGNDVLFGGGGDDILNGGPGVDSLNGGDGIDDVADYSDRTTPVKVVLGDGLPDGGIEDGSGDTIGVLVEDIWGGQASDQLTGNFDDNVIDGGLGADVIQGGPGFDFADYSTATSPVTADLDGQVGDDGRAGEGDSLGLDVESILGGLAGDTLGGGTGDDFLAGGPGDDALNAGPGADLVYGEDGNDTIVATDGVLDFIDCGVGFDTVFTDVGDTVAGCEVHRFGVPPPPPPPPPVSPVHRVSFTGVSGNSKSGVTVGLRCESNQASHCRVRLTLKTTVVIGGKRRTYVLGQLAGALPAGTARSFRVPLNKRAASLFKTRTRLGVRIESYLRTPAGSFANGPIRTLVVKRVKATPAARLASIRELHRTSR